MLRRTALAATALLAAGALLLTACTGGGSSPDPTTTSEPDPDASAIIRLVLEPGNLDIRETAGAALDQILVDNIYQGLVSAPPSRTSCRRSRGLDGLGGRADLHVHAARGRHLPRRPGAHPAGCRLVAADAQGHPGVARLGAARQRRDDRRGRAGHHPDAHRSRTSSLLWNLTGRAGLILKEGDTVDYQTGANGTGPVRARRLAAGRQHHLRAQRRVLGRAGAGRRGRLRLHPRQPGGAQRRARRRGRRAHRVRREPEGADRGERRLHARPGPVDRQGHAGVQPEPRVRSPTSACGRRSARRSTTRRSSRRSRPARPCTARSLRSTPATRISPMSPRTTRRRPRRCWPKRDVEDLTLHPHDPELLLHDDPADPGLGPRTRSASRSRSTRSTSRRGSTTCTSTRTTT